MKRLLLVIVLLMFFAPRIWSQDDATSSPTSTTPWLPPKINGQVNSLAFSSESRQTNLLSVGVALSTIYDDNARSNNSHPVGNFGYWIAPNISIQETRTRVAWSLHYAPGFILNQRIGNQYAHDLFFNSQFRFTERLTLQIGDDFTRATTSSIGLNENPLQPAGNVLQQPNASIVTPLARRTSNGTHLDLVYQLGEGTTVGVGGSFNERKYGDVANGVDVQLLNSQSGTATAYYSHQFSRKHSFGVTYLFSRVTTSGQIREGANSHSVQLFYTFAPTASTTLSLFAGPDQTSTSDDGQIPIQIGPFVFYEPISYKHQSWTGDGGMTFGWQGRRNSIRAMLVRHMSDGGGLTGAVRSNSGDVRVRRQLSERCTGNLSVVYGTNDALSYLYGKNFQTVSGIAGFQYALGQHLSLTLNYARDHQNFQTSSNGAAPFSSSISRNRAWFSIAYHATRPLGQ